ncbi:hypothetical protein MMC34_007374 [Xylographa carneopallida]|nr:hypothetical protein [Xylographa carneopallida]
MSDTSPTGRDSPIRAINPALLSLPSTPASAVSPVHVPDPEGCAWLQELSEPFQSQFYTSMTETSNPEPHSPSVAFTELYQTSHSRTLPDATRSAAQSPRAPFADDFSQLRAHSQPPEEVFRPDSLPRSRRPRHPYPAAQLRHLQKQTSHPYARPSSNRTPRSLAPRSAPTSGSATTVPQHLPQEPNTHPSASILSSSANSTEPFLPTSRSPETSTSISIAHQVHQLQAAVSTLQTYLSQAFRPPADDPDREAIETARHAARQHNHALTELHEFLTPLPTHAGALRGAVAAPITGAALRRLDHAALDGLLDAYDVPFSPGMFLGEKKALYLQFVGAGRGLMHRVLD